MAAAESVVFAFRPTGKAAQSVYFPQGGKAGVAAGEHFMGVALVPYIENQLVPGAIQHPVQRQRQLHHPQIGGQMPAVHPHGVNDFRSYFPRQLLQFPFGQAAQLGGGGYFG